MSIRWTCPYCATPDEVDEQFAGAQILCRKCQQPIQVPPVTPLAAVPSGLPLVAAPPAPPAAAVAVTPAPADVRPPGPAAPSRDPSPFLPQIQRHIEETIGRAQAFQGVGSSEIRIDLHIVPPTNQPPSPAHPRGTRHYTVVTSGLSARPMHLPAGSSSSPFAELMICLPADWPGMKPDGTFDRRLMRDENNWWPIRWLRAIARMPQQLNTCIEAGHTIGNGQIAAPFASDTALCGMLVQPPVLSPQASGLVISDEVAIEFHALWPIYREEMELKMNRGLDALLELFTLVELSELVQIDRKNLALDLR